MASLSVGSSSSERLTCNQGSSPQARYNFTQEPWNEPERPWLGPATDILFQPPSVGGAEVWLAFQAFLGTVLCEDLKSSVEICSLRESKKNNKPKFNYLPAEDPCT